MPKFSEYIKTDIVDDKTQNISNTEDINKLIEKYSTYSYDELMSEFLHETEKKKQNGELTSSKLNTIKTTLKPYLSDEKLQKLDDLFDKVGK